MSQEYFFELLTEEIPAWMLTTRINVLREQLVKLLTDYAGASPSAEQIHVDATSRRIFFVLRDLPAQQPDRAEELKGPSSKAAWTADGTAGPALLGFLKKNNATIEQTIRRDDYVWLNRVVPGLRADVMLQAAIPKLIESIRWPKMMRFGVPSQSFIRPVHGVVSLLDGKLLPMTIFSIEASTITEGHRIIGDKSVVIESYQSYLSALRASGVEPLSEVRVQKMRERAVTLASEAGGVPAEDETIWEQWRFLTEHPNLVRAEFRQEFLNLPEEVLVTVMRVHQKQLPVMSDGKLRNYMLAIVDQLDDGDGNAAAGNSFVTNARFADALFFYETDQKRRLRERLPEIERLQFQEKLGNYREKTIRVRAIAEKIHASSKSATSLEDLRTAADLCKTDLVTEMVKEFTELQGKIGGIYARNEKLPDNVSEALYDHYLPANTDDLLPRGETGALLALADRIDTLAGFFVIGLKPTGSKDPFALRRAAQGIVQLLLHSEKWRVRISIEELIDSGLAAYSGGDASVASTRIELLAFFEERVKTLLEHPAFGFAYDEIAAAMAAGWSRDLPDLVDRTRAFHDIRSSSDFLSLLDSAKRIANITASAGEGTLDVPRLQHDREKRLAELASVVAEQIGELTAARDYRAALESFAALAPELEAFFVEVMVMVEDLPLRENRIALLRMVGSAASSIGDVTAIVVDRSEYQQKR